MKMWDKTILQQTISRITAILCGILGLLFVLWITGNVGRGTSPEVGTVTPPVVAIPSSTVAGGASLATSTRLNSSPYQASSDVLTNSSTYKNEAIRLVLNGKFSIAQIHATGKVNEGGNHFIYFSYGTSGGVLNAARTSADSLNADLTTYLGGIFTKDKPIDLTIDLLGTTIIAPTKSEFLLNKQPTKGVDFWDSNSLPPTVIPFVIAPFNQSGTVGGATLDEVDFQYACSPGSACGVKTCPSGTFATACLKEYFGIQAAKDWCARAGLSECNKL